MLMVMIMTTMVLINDYKDGAENASHFIKMTNILKMILLLVSNDNDNNHNHDCMGCHS